MWLDLIMYVKIIGVSIVKEGHFCQLETRASVKFLSDFIFLISEVYYYINTIKRSVKPSYEWFFCVPYNFVFLFKPTTDHSSQHFQSTVYGWPKRIARDFSSKPLLVPVSRIRKYCRKWNMWTNHTRVNF